MKTFNLVAGILCLSLSINNLIEMNYIMGLILLIIGIGNIHSFNK